MLSLSKAAGIYFAISYLLPSHRVRFLQFGDATSVAVLLVEVSIGHYGTPWQEEIPTQAPGVSTRRRGFRCGGNFHRMQGRELTGRLFFHRGTAQHRLTPGNHADSASGDHSRRARTCAL